MSDEQRNLVPFSRSRRRPDPKRVEEFKAMARRLQHERETADVVQSLLRDTPQSQWASLASRAELVTVGAVERLGQEVESRLDREPREALAIAELATTAADALPDDSYPPVVLAQVRAHAWKDRGQSLCYLARHDEALEALDRADQVLESAGTLAHDLAIVRFVRATTLQEVNRFDDSLRLLTECRVVFRSHGDVRRFLLCGIAEGVLLQRLKRFREARDVFAPLLEIAQELGDTECCGSIHNNLGYACIEVGDFVTAERHIARASDIFRELHQPVRVAIAELARGRVLTRRGDVEGAIRHLDRIRRDLLGRGVVEEAGICGLEIVETLLIANRPSEAESLARDVIRDFNAARLNARAITALGFLHEAIATRTASAQTVDHVRQYIQSLRKYPTREFAAAV